MHAAQLHWTAVGGQDQLLVTLLQVVEDLEEGVLRTFQVGKVLDIVHNQYIDRLIEHGADENIAIDAHAHIGTDRLSDIITRIRKTIEDHGGAYYFDNKVTDLILDGDKVIGVKTSGGNTFEGCAVILATGHSARDVYQHLYASGIDIEAKGIAVGVRLEHPAELIDQIQYHNKHGRGKYLPAAEYSFVSQVDGRGVYSFCMCPGGAVVPAASGPEQIVVNGMSASHRNSRWSNAGMVVEIRPEDISLIDNSPLAVDNTTTQSSSIHPLAMLHLQEELERQCWMQGNRRQTAPAQRMVDFTRRKLSYDLPPSSYTPGLISSPLHFWMPEFISSRLQKGFEHFGRTSRALHKLRILYC